MYEATTWIVGLIVWGLIWGAVSRQCVVNRGYEEEGGKYFALGFFFGIIGIILAVSKPDVITQRQIIQEQMRQNPINDPVSNFTSYEGSWVCNCGTQNISGARFCNFCGKERNTVAGASTVKSPNWVCPECGNLNPNSSRICKDCSHEK